MGLHNNSVFAGAVKLICKFLCRSMNGAPFTSFTILDQCMSSLHVDSNNEPESWNLVVPLSKFRGGNIWYECEQGCEPCPSDPRLFGKILRLELGPQWLSATRHKHCTLPWTGRRCVLVAFCTRFSDHLKPSEVCTLRDLGFNLGSCISTGEVPPFGTPLANPKLQDMLVVELCCGSAGISKACSDSGFQTLALDARPPAAAAVRVLKFDLLQPDAVGSLSQMLCLEADRIALVWARVPSSTTNRIKEKPLSRAAKAAFSAPKPLRTLESPDGVPGLRGVDKGKLETANLVFESVCDLLTKASKQGIRCVIENPTHSVFWATSWFRSLEVLSPQSHWISFHLCAHGGDRPRQVSLWASSDFLSPLTASCPGETAQHRHSAWKPGFQQGKSCSSSPQAYPALLCQRIAGLLRQAVLKAGAVDDTSLPAAVQRQELSTARMVLGLQPRKAPRLLPEFGYFVHVVQPVDSVRPLQDAPPKGHLLSRHLSTWGEVQAEKRVPNVGVQCKVLDPQPHTKVEVFRFGIPLPPEKFLQRAVDVGHPHSFASSLEPSLKEVVDENISGDEVVLSKRRLKFVAKWTARAKELEAREAELQQSLPEHVRKILKGKRLLLWKEMIDEYDLPDKGLIDDMMAGFPLCGWLPKSSAFPAQVRRPEFSVDTLKHLADGLNKATREKMAQRQSPELEQATWNETLAELQSEWIWQAPDREEDIKVYARRFGLDQHGKIRVIDDCSCCGLNATVGVVERFVVHAIDRMASMLAYALEVSKDASTSLCGRTCDLKSAYKQFPVSCKDRDLLRMWVNCPHRDSPVSVGVNSLPFGAIGSVAAFLRISNSIWMMAP